MDPGEDELEHYNYEQDKYMSSHSGKGRSKKEAEQHTNHHDPSGHTRKTVQKLVNNSHKQQDQKPHPVTKKSDGNESQTKEN